MLELKIPQNQNEVLDNLEVRYKVFHLEQNINIEDDFDGLDELSTLFVLYLDNLPIGASRIRLLDEYIWKLERFCILENYRNNKYGSFMLNKIEEHIKSLNFSEVTLNSQENAINFYLKNGYKQISDFFIEADIKHIKMKKEL